MSQAETGLRLKAARRTLGLSVARAGELAGASSSTIKRWEAGKGLPGRSEISAYLTRLGAPSFSIDLPKEVSAGRISQRLLRSKRRRTGLTLEELSLSTGVSITSLYRYETGARSPEAESLQQLARAYGCSSEEAELLSKNPSPPPNSAVEDFLVPSGQPHYWLYRRLEEWEGNVETRTPECVLDLIHGFLVMGDHRGLLEVWGEVRASLDQHTISTEFADVIRASVALAQLTVTGDKAQARAFLSRYRNRENDLPLLAISHLARLAVLIGEVELAEELLNRLDCLAHRHRDRGMIFVSLVSRIMFEFSRTKSPKLADALSSLRNKAEGPLQHYTLDVAELDLLLRLKEYSAAISVLDRCKESEETFGFGSPLATRIRRTI